MKIEISTDQDRLDTAMIHDLRICSMSSCFPSSAVGVSLSY